MRKNYPLQVSGRHPDRVLDAIKHDVRKYLRRERRRELPPEAQLWDFDCKVGPTQNAAQEVATTALIAAIDSCARSGASQVYVQVLARAAQRPPRPAAAPEATHETAPTATDLPAAD